MVDQPTSASSSPYPTTQWTQVIEVIQRGDGVKAREALGEFCERYRPAIYQFFRNHGRCSHEQAEDYAHSFLSSRIFECLEEGGGFLHKAQRSDQGKFRSFLAHVMWRYLMDERKRENTHKSGGSVPHIALDGLELPSEDGNQQSFKRFGGMVDLEVAVEIIRRAAERFKHSEYLIAHFRGDLSQKEAAGKLGLSENAFRQAYCRFRERLAISLWEEVAKLVGPDEKEIRAEIRYLMSLFAEAIA
jgi:DNA-directed RNA polymerase specialized sigma24 family protein